MSYEYMGDLSSYFGLSRTPGVVEGTNIKISESNDNAALEMTDFLTLMVAQFQYQGLDSTADTSDMLNQMVQMSVVQAITEISQQISTMTDASVMSYASSLVGKEVTVGTYNADGVLEETVGTITGTGIVDGEQVVFIGDETYYLANIMAVGRLPEIEPPADPEGGDDGNTDDGAGETGGTDETGSTGGTESSGGTGETGGVDGTESSGGTEGGESTGESAEESGGSDTSSVPETVGNPIASGTITDALDETVSQTDGTSSGGEDEGSSIVTEAVGDQTPDAAQ